MTEKQVVAAFDFDGTLTYRDTLVPFLLEIVGPTGLAYAIMKNLPSLIGYPFGFSSRQQIKEGLLKETIGGMTLQDVLEKGKEFALNTIPNKLNPAAMKKLKWHLDQGHRCVLISANLNVYLVPWSQKEKLQDTLCSNLQVDEQGKVTGLLAGKNCRGVEKKRRLLELLGDRSQYVLYAYGDSNGDKELLEMADHPFYRKFD